MEAPPAELSASRDGVRLAGAAFAANYVGRAKVRRRARSAAAMPQMGQTIHSADHRMSCGRRLMVQYCCRQRLRGESPRQYLHMVLESSRLSTYIDTLQIILSLLLVGFAIFLVWDGPEATEQPTWMAMAELVFTLFFVVDYLMHFYAAESRLAFLTSFFALIDLVTIVPVLFRWGVSLSSGTSLSEVQTVWRGPVRVLRALRILRAYRILSFSRSAVQRQLFMVLLTVVSVIVCTTGIMQALEYDHGHEGPVGQSLSFLDAMYFIIVTITTVGFGDIAPLSDYGKVTIMVMITASMILIPTQVSKLSTMLANRSAFDGEYKDRGKSHVLVCGDPPAHSLVYFLHEFFNASSKMTSERVVIMGRNEPSYELRRLLSTRALERRVKYYRGNAMLDRDLYRAKAHQAKAAFVMLSTKQQDQETLDTAASLVTSSIRAFIARGTRSSKRVGPRCPVFTQITASSNLRHAHLAGAAEVLGTHHLKYSVLGLSAQIPGFSTFLSNLLTTFPRDDVAHDPTWLDEYSVGTQNEIYMVPFPAGMHGLTFHTAAELVLKEIGAVLIGVEMDPTVEGEDVRPAHMFIAEERQRLGQKRGNSAHTQNSKKQEPQRRVIKLAPLNYYVNAPAMDNAILICKSPARAERLARVQQSRVSAYRIVQNYFRESFRRKRALSMAIRSRTEDHEGWKKVKLKLQQDGISLMAKIANQTPPMVAEPTLVSSLSGGSANSDTFANFGPSNEEWEAAGHYIARRSRRIEAMPAATREALVEKVSDLVRPDSVFRKRRLTGTTTTVQFSVGAAGASVTPDSKVAPELKLTAHDSEASVGAVLSPPQSPAVSTNDKPYVQQFDSTFSNIARVDTFSSDVTAATKPPALETKPAPGAPAAFGAGAGAGAGASTTGSMSPHFRAPSADSLRSDALGLPRRDSTPSQQSITPKVAYTRPMHGRRGRHTPAAGTLADPMPYGDMGRETLTALYNAFLMGQPPQVAKHVLVCGLPDDLENFVTPLRSRDVGDHVTPIVILALRKPTMRSFSRIMDVPKLHYYYGSPRDPGALRDACLGRASTIVILANPSRSDDDDFVSEEDLMVDADAMTTLRYVLQVTEKMQSDRRPHVVVELVRTSNIKFVQYQKASFSSDASRFDYYDESDEEDDFESLRHGTDELELMLRPAYASGQVCTSHFMEGLLGTSFHKRYAVRVTQLLLRGITEESRRSTSQSPQHSDSGVLNQNQNAESKASFGSQSSEDGCVLHSVRVPPWAHRQSVMDVFTRLAQKHKQVLVAVYRSGRGQVLAPAPYIVTNPLLDMQLDISDRFLLLGQPGVELGLE